MKDYIGGIIISALLILGMVHYWIATDRMMQTNVEVR
jgi:hypothetical protein